MSFSMYGRPAPVDRPEAVELGQVKRRLSHRLWGHDGSLRSEPVTIDRSLLPYLEGMRDGAQGELRRDVELLIALIDANPQGVELWIGDHSDTELGV